MPRCRGGTLRACVWRSRSGRAFLLLIVAAVVATGLVVVGAGPSRQAGAAVSPGATQLVSDDRQPPFAGSGQPAISADGRYVAFSTLKSFDPLDILRPGGSDLDVYVRDLREGGTVLLSHGVLLSPDNVVGTEGIPDLVTVAANGSSRNPSISADGRYVAFETTASNLGPPDHDRRADVVMVDRDPDGDGVFDEKDCLLLRLYCHEFTRVSPDRRDERERPVAQATAPSISAAGDAVAWVGMRPGEAAGRRGGVPVVYRSTLGKGPTGAITTVRSQQVNPGIEDLPVRSTTSPALSGDARRLALVAQVEPDADDGIRSAVLGVDLSAGPLPESDGEQFAATRLDVDGDGRPLSLPPDFAAAPALSGDGGQVAFTTPGAGSQVIRTVSWRTGQDLRSQVVSSDTSGNPVHGTDPALSANGRYLAFATFARGVHNGVDGPGTECDPNTDPGTDLGFDDPPPAQAPPPPDAPSHCDVVVRDLALDAARAAAGLPRLPAELASPSLARNCGAPLAPEDTCEGDDASRHPALSADGAVVAFESQADTLVADDPNGAVPDVFARTFTPRLTAEPLEFFTIEPGSSTMGSARLEHEGFGPLLVESMTVTGANAAEFTVTGETCISRVLHAGEACLASLQFAPSVVGPHQAVLEVRYRGLGSPLAVPLSGLADVAPPQAFSATPNPLAFGDNLTLSTNPPAAVTVTNNGRGQLRIDNVSLPPNGGTGKHPEDYAITANTCANRTLRPGESCEVTVQHSPQGVGERPAVLRFDDTAPNGPHLVGLQGSGTQPQLQFNPAVTPAGRVVSLIGSGFAPQRAVTVQLREFQQTITATTDAAGNFNASMIVFPNTQAGERIADATVDGHQPPITATASLLVVPGTASPPDFQNRR
ncbi:MAG: choice-of-anchor D domain-containing protein [Actinomycetota bacterium]|nr:choice-of-anchor D domain-containing protein [Actinomycetota bacterium]